MSTLELTPEGRSEQALMETLIAGLKNRPVPQAVDESQPCRLPPGKTAMRMVYQQLSADESDEEIRKVLEKLR